MNQSTIHTPKKEKSDGAGVAAAPSPRAAVLNTDWIRSCVGSAICRRQRRPPTYRLCQLSSTTAAKKNGAHHPLRLEYEHAFTSRTETALNDTIADLRSHQLLEALELIDMVLSSDSHPSSVVLASMVHTYMREDVPVRRRCLEVLHLVVYYHPPQSRPLRKLYHAMLCDSAPSNWPLLASVVGRCLDGPIGTPHHRTDVALLDFIVGLFEADVTAWSNRLESPQEVLGRGTAASPLVARAVWQRGDMVGATNAATCELCQWVVAARAGTAATDVYYCLLRLLAMVAEMVRQASQFRVLEETTKMARLRREFCFAIQEHGLSGLDVENLLCSLKPGWFKASVAAGLMELRHGVARPAELTLEASTAAYFSEPGRDAQRPDHARDRPTNVGPPQSSGRYRQRQKENEPEQVVPDRRPALSPVAIQLPSGALKRWCSTPDDLPPHKRPKDDLGVTDSTASALSSARLAWPGAARLACMQPVVVLRRHRLLSKQSAADSRPDDSATPTDMLRAACIRNEPALLAECLRRPGVCVNARDKAGRTALHETASRGHTDCVRLLLDHRSRVGLRSCPPAVSQSAEPDNSGRRPTESGGRLDVRAVSAAGLTALHEAVLADRTDVCRLLAAELGPGPLQQPTGDGRTAVALAASDAMRRLLADQAAVCDYSLLLLHLLGGLLADSGLAEVRLRLLRERPAAQPAPLPAAVRRCLTGHLLMRYIRDLRCMQDQLWRSAGRRRALLPRFVSFMGLMCRP